MDPGNTNKTETLAQICEQLKVEDHDSAQQMIEENYPLKEPPEDPTRNFSRKDKLKIFIRDGFKDRYTGKKLVFPGTLRLLSEIFPDKLPYHKNWKRSESHRMYWQLFPTIDHVNPLAEGGADDESNWGTTSMLANSAKGSWQLEDFGLELLQPGEFDEWDGLLSFFMEYLEDNEEHETEYLMKWKRTAKKVLNSP